MSRGGNICSWATRRNGWTGLWTLIVALVAGCAAPSNDYVRSAYMMRLGEEARAKSGRQLNEARVPDSATRPVVVPIIVEPDAVFTFIAATQVEVLPIAVPEPPTEAPTPVAAKAVVAIGVDLDRLKTFLREQYTLGVVNIQPSNGRFTGDKNLLRIDYIPAPRDESQVLRDYQLICAAIVGMDPAETVDTVIAFGLDPRLIPWISVSGDVWNFLAYQAEEMTSTQYNERLSIRKF
ncbi:MAG: hypothetical protein O3A46_07535 [Candidatus Poribacteria bacterium]|nr:hypothetical protein [Candidatus Poribacteria bacterium]